jgi:hypothetical protein
MSNGTPNDISVFGSLPKLGIAAGLQDILDLQEEPDPDWSFRSFNAKGAGLRMGWSWMVRLRRMGWRTAEGIYSAAEVGASHRRPVLYVLGCLADTEPPRPHLPTWPRRAIEEPCSAFQPVARRRDVLKIFRDVPTDTVQFDWFPAYPQAPQLPFEPPRTTQSAVGRTTNGLSGRVEQSPVQLRNARLRLLGDEAVPQAAINAYIQLWKKLTGKEIIYG